MSAPQIAVVRCSRHGVWALTVDDGMSGTRLTSGKCCGTWDVNVHVWHVDAEQLRAIASDLSKFAESVEAKP